MRPQDASTFREILDHHLQLVAVCHRCGKWRRVDVAVQVLLGRGDHEFRRHHPHCRRCETRGCYTVWWPAGYRDGRPAGAVLPFRRR